MVETFGVNLRTASRYLAEIRKYLVEREEQDHVHRELYYDRARKVYRIRELEEEMIRPSELYAIGKILLASRAFHKKELESLLRRLLQSAVLGTDKKEVERYIRGELFDYLDPAHEKPDVENLWTAAGAVKKHHILSFDYRRQGEKEASPHEICPEGVLFSEYYFYVVGIPKAEEKAYRRRYAGLSAGPYEQPHGYRRIFYRQLRQALQRRHFQKQHPVYVWRKTRTYPFPL